MFSEWDSTDAGFGALLRGQFGAAISRATRRVSEQLSSRWSVQQRVQGSGLYKVPAGAVGTWQTSHAHAHHGTNKTLVKCIAINVNNSIST